MHTDKTRQPGTAIAGAVALLFALSAFAAPAAPDARFVDGCSPLDGNPARGPAPGGWHVLEMSGNKAGDPHGFCSWLWNLKRFSAGNEYKGEPAPDSVGGADLPLTRDALASVSNTLANARANGAFLIVRFGYTSESDNGSEPGDFSMLIRHVSQLGPVLAAFPDVVLAVECGMVGPWGEMHSSNYREPSHIRALTDAWLSTLSPQTPLLVRYPKWILDYADVDTLGFLREVADGTYYKKRPAQRRIGMFNDGYLGNEHDYGTWRNGERWMNREQGVAYLEARRNVPYGGELAHITKEAAEAIQLFDTSCYNIVREFYRTHLSYLRNIDNPGHVLAAHIEEMRLTHAYDFAGMPDLSEWYGRNLREFIRTHMGYRFVIRGVAFGKDGVEISVENTGFGHLLLKSRAELSVGGKTVSVPLDLRKLPPCGRKAYVLSPGSQLPRSGSVLLRLCLDTPHSQTVLFANDAMREGDSFRLR